MIAGIPEEEEEESVSVALKTEALRSGVDLTDKTLARTPLAVLLTESIIGSGGVLHFVCNTRGFVYSPIPNL